jgi:dihydroneopterin aldolase
VVSTRTELDWAMKNDQICVWAPSKIVLDAVDGPSGDTTAVSSDPVALAAWFAATFEAGVLLVIGADLPDDAQVPLRAVPVTQAAL